MTVKELIAKLRTCYANAIVEVDGGHERADVEGLEETFYNHPSNRYVMLKSALSHRMAFQEPQELKEKLRRIREIIEE